MDNPRGRPDRYEALISVARIAETARTYFWEMKSAVYWIDDYVVEKKDSREKSRGS